MTEKKQPDQPSEEQPLDPDFAGALVALRRAARIARRRAIETSGYVAVWRNGRIVYDTQVEPPEGDERG